MRLFRRTCMRYIRHSITPAPLLDDSRKVLNGGRWRVNRIYRLPTTRTHSTLLIYSLSISVLATNDGRSIAPSIDEN